MIVISDTSCISAFIQAGLTDLLPRLFGEVIVPEQVLRELQALSDFGMDVTWLPTTSWLKVKRATPNLLLSQLLHDLDEGHDPQVYCIYTWRQPVYIIRIAGAIY